MKRRIVAEDSYWLTFAVMLAVGVLVSTLTARPKERADAVLEHVTSIDSLRA